MQVVIKCVQVVGCIQVTLRVLLAALLVDLAWAKVAKELILWRVMAITTWLGRNMAQHAVHRLPMKREQNTALRGGDETEDDGVGVVDVLTGVLAAPAATAAPRVVRATALVAAAAEASARNTVEEKKKRPQAKRRQSKKRRKAEVVVEVVAGVAAEARAEKRLKS